MQQEQLQSSSLSQRMWRCCCTAQEMQRDKTEESPLCPSSDCLFEMDNGSQEEFSSSLIKIQ